MRRNINTERLSRAAATKVVAEVIGCEIGTALIRQNPFSADTVEIPTLIIEGREEWLLPPMGGESRSEQVLSCGGKTCRVIGSWGGGGRPDGPRRPVWSVYIDQ